MREYLNNKNTKIRNGVEGRIGKEGEEEEKEEKKGKGGKKRREELTKERCHIPISFAMLLPGGKTSNAKAQSTD